MSDRYPEEFILDFEPSLRYFILVVFVLCGSWYIVDESILEIIGEF